MLLSVQTEVSGDVFILRCDGRIVFLAAPLGHLILGFTGRRGIYAAAEPIFPVANLVIRGLTSLSKSSQASRSSSR